MNGTPIFTQALVDCRDVLLVGGKAANLGRLIRAGFQVPPGFAVTTRAFSMARAQAEHGAPLTVSQDAVQEILLAYREIGAGLVAVRSSATTEDAPNASMAGQYQTFLNVEGEQALLDAVQRCWGGAGSAHSRAYLSEHSIDESRVAMAVVVQKQVHADVAGVMFTTNPRPGGCGQMLVEASWGLGEAVVSGRVQPDVLCLDYQTGRVLSAEIADKHIQLPTAPGGEHEQPVEQSRRKQPCLGGRDVYNLWQAGRQVADHFGRPQDIEWAIHDGNLFLLQSRPITTLADAEAGDQVLRATREELQRKLAAGRGPWALHNLSETLAHPTPLTWSVIRHMMSQRGGLGAMYRQAGYQPSSALGAEGFLDLVAGRIYMDASRAPLMLLEDFPFAYDPNVLRTTPDPSQTSPTIPLGSPWRRARAARRLAEAIAKLRAMAVDFDARLRNTLFKQVASYVAAERQVDMQALDAQLLADLWQDRRKQVLDIYAADLLTPALICGMAMEELRAFLAEHFWDLNQDFDALARQISSASPPDATLLANAELYEVGKGARTLESWLVDHGHRAPGEMDLAEPRYRQRPAAAAELAASLSAGEAPLDRCRRHREDVAGGMKALYSRLNARNRRQLDALVDLVGRYVAFREECKDRLMLAYDLLRDAALEIGRRLEIVGDVFYLSERDMLESLQVGFAPHHLIEQRKLAYRAEISMQLPRVIDSAAIDDIGRPVAPAQTSSGYRALSVSGGQAEGAVLVARSHVPPTSVPAGCILVAPSTDPSWTPLFAQAGALVLERGGALSHGAVVAREMGLPAVVLPDATNLLRDGENVHVDGNRGWVDRLDEKPADGAASPAADPNDMHIPTHLTPPPPGRQARRAGKVRNCCAAVWAVYLLAMFLLPEAWLYQPTLSAIDLLLWPVVRSMGKPAAVAIVAIAVALASLLLQKLITDNRRLVEAKRRAAALTRQARSLPADSPRRAAMLRLAGPVTVRTLLAAMVPMGILLGPMVMPLVWFSHRVDASVNNAPAGSAVQIVAMIDGDYDQPVRLDSPASLPLDETTPASCTLPPIRKTLQRLEALLRHPTTAPSEAWEVSAVQNLSRQQTADDLHAYLAAGIPPQGVTWMLRPADGVGGRFTVSVAAQKGAPVSVDVVLGNDFPPASRLAAGRAGSPVKSVQVVYPQTREKPVFWQPLKFMEGRSSIPLAGKLAAVNVGWLLLYILVYLPVLMLVRWSLRVA